jgi:hypothetical protein
MISQGDPDAMETTFDAGTAIGKVIAYTALNPGQEVDGKGQVWRSINLHREPDGSLVLLSRTNPEPDKRDDPDEVVNAMVIPPALAADVLAIFGLV